MAVDQAFRPQRPRSALLADALARAARSEIAASAMSVDAQDKATLAFYLHHGFIHLPDSPLAIFLPLVTVRSKLQSCRARLLSLDPWNVFDFSAYPFEPP